MTVRTEIEQPVHIQHRSLHRQCIIVAASRATYNDAAGAWKAYVHIVPGKQDHQKEALAAWHEGRGSKLSETDARHFFPREPWASLPYAD
jgi:hypothetical protein